MINIPTVKVGQKVAVECRNMACVAHFDLHLEPFHEGAPDEVVNDFTDKPERAVLNCPFCGSTEISVENAA